MQILNHLGCCYRKLSKLEEARGFFEQALKISKFGRGVTLLNLAEVHGQMGQ